MSELSADQINQQTLDAIDAEGFAREFEELRDEAIANLGEKDFRHLRRLEIFGRVCAVLGLATAWIYPNPITVFLLATGLGTRWLLEHHVSHGGYDKVPGIPERYTSKKFALGWRRYLDWFDWIRPDAWMYEHNTLHHYYTGEETDPDLVERNAEDINSLPIPMFVKYLVLFFVSITWKVTYYAPNTLNGIESKRRRKDPSRPVYNITTFNFLDFRNPLVRELWATCYFPYFTWHFVLLPAAFLPLGTTAATYVLINKAIAELVHNFHSFFIITPNHAGDDLYRFDSHYKNKEEFYVNQVIGSVNYHTGSDLLDYPQYWLNYQIEHHLAPALPMSTYQEIQPKVKALCEKYNIPYIQESVFKRFWKLVEISVGKTKMLRLDEDRMVYSISRA